MPIGVTVNACSVLFRGLIGAFLGDKIPERLRLALPLTFGAASMVNISYNPLWTTGKHCIITILR